MGLRRLRQAFSRRSSTVACCVPLLPRTLSSYSRAASRRGRGALGSMVAGCERSIGTINTPLTGGVTRSALWEVMLAEDDCAGPPLLGVLGTAAPPLRSFVTLGYAAEPLLRPLSAGSGVLLVGFLFWRVFGAGRRTSTMAIGGGWYVVRSRAAGPSVERKPS